LVKVKSMERTIVEEMWGIYSLSYVKKRMSKEREELDKRYYQRATAGERFGRVLYDAMVNLLKEASDYRTQNQKNTEK